MVTPSDPFGGIWRFDECRAFILREKFHGTAFMAFVWNGKDTLALQSVGGFTEGHVTEKRMQRCESGVSSSHADVPLFLEMEEKLHEEGCI